MSERVDAARRAVRKVLRDARDKNKWRKIVRFRLWMPVALQVLLVAALLWYTNSRFPGFVNATNVSQILILALPLIVAAMAQTHALLVGYLDLSVGGMIGLGVVIASFLIGAEASVPQILIGIGVILLCGVALGLVNAGLIRGLKIPSIIATLATLSILDGISLTLRPTAQGVISPDLVSVLTTTHRTDPRGVHRHRRRGGSRRCLAPRLRIGSRAEGGGFRRTVGQTRRGQDQLAPGPGPPPVGGAGGRGLVLRHGPIPDRQRTGRLHLRAEQHHRRRPGRRVPRRWPGHVHRRARWRRSSSRSSSPSCPTSVCHPTTDR